MKNKLIILLILLLSNLYTCNALELSTNPRVYKQKLIKEAVKLNNMLSILRNSIGVDINLSSSEEAMNFFVVHMSFVKTKNNTLSTNTDINNVRMTDTTYKFKCINNSCDIIIDTDGGFGANKITIDEQNIYDQIVINLSKDQNNNLIIKNPEWIEKYLSNPFE